MFHFNVQHNITPYVQDEYTSFLKRHDVKFESTAAESGASFMQKVGVYGDQHTFLQFAKNLISNSFSVEVGKYIQQLTKKELQPEQKISTLPLILIEESQSEAVSFIQKSVMENYDQQFEKSQSTQMGQFLKRGEE